MFRSSNASCFDGMLIKPPSDYISFSMRHAFGLHALARRHLLFSCTWHVLGVLTSYQSPGFDQCPFPQRQVCSQLFNQLDSELARLRSSFRIIGDDPPVKSLGKYLLGVASLIPMDGQDVGKNIYCGFSGIQLKHRGLD